jgi:hypothetical protein
LAANPPPRKAASTEVMYLSRQKQILITNVKVYDVNGKRLKTEGSKQENEYILNVSDFPAGVYFIQCQTEQGTVTKKFVKN